MDLNGQVIKISIKNRYPDTRLDIHVRFDVLDIFVGFLGWILQWINLDFNR